MNDPYLDKPGVACEVWNDKYIINGNIIKRFKHTVNNIPFFTGFTTWSHYRPINTEWDYAPDWAVCSTVDRNGEVTFWEEIPSRDAMDLCVWLPGGDTKQMACGICPDKSRYQGDAWKNSLRMRPEWAKVK